ncbi:hypothetical protein KQH42_28310 [Streptomyces sp. CHA1]|uniref:hypothetical protein n=1 Tax=Streptomyces TaxID=1883 RepID=UPI001BFC2BE5|nr:MULTISPECIES: hypothetical protein [unclassified Streptomyces]MBT3160122.1 hypothetical protein [Streptomyces sp. G11C]MCO6704326.1 hypothetical protein [Streptomyces sp. CHB9.2]MCO6710596.1 hypothetical protein [Streptomyces sp. CHA3]MCO6716396.1 hypothetical protein [Streptomyces sp. CHB19.2]MCO6722527.1 hypothetical protein [Streptomyces sp. Vc714c-19]
MAINLLCNDPASSSNNRPTLYYDQTDAFLRQPWIVQDQSGLEGLQVPAHATVVEFPRLFEVFPGGTRRSP